MSKVYKITAMSQLALVKNAFDNRKVPANQLQGSYLYDVYFGSHKESVQAYKRLEFLLKNNGGVLYFDFNRGNYFEGLYGFEGKDEIVSFDYGRYRL